MVGANACGVAGEPGGVCRAEMLLLPGNFAAAAASATRPVQRMAVERGAGAYRHYRCFLRGARNSRDLGGAPTFRCGEKSPACDGGWGGPVSFPEKVGAF